MSSASILTNQPSADRIPETNKSDLGKQESPRLPKALFFVSREEFYGQDADHQPLELIIKEGLTDRDCQLPEDLQGHMFVVGPAGTIDSPKYDGSDYVVEPAQSGWTPLYNGDGMVYRLDFHQTPDNPESAIAGTQSMREETGKAWMATRIMKTPDYYADLGIYQNPMYQEKWPKEYQFLKFRNFGLSRLSFSLGVRNYLNTALLPLTFSENEQRLLVTWDAGRPYEVNTISLGLDAPVGWNREWYPMTSLKPSLPFPVILSTAHPQFDPNTGEMFTVNAGKSLSTLLWLSRWLSFNFNKILNEFVEISIHFFIKKIVDLCLFLIVYLLELIEYCLHWIDIGGNDFVSLKRWNGKKTSVEQWEIVDGFGRPIKIKQSLHQMGLTKDYIILSDSALKLALEDLIPNANRDIFREERLNEIVGHLRKYLSYPELPYTDLYIIARKDLKADVKKVPAKRVRIQPETTHFLLDYANDDSKITFHVAHNAASDPTEFIHETDRFPSQDTEMTETLRSRSGMIASPMDASRLACWEIDVKNYQIKKTFLSEKECREYLWSLAIYTGQSDRSNQFTDIYWNCWGAWPELLSEFIVDMYKDYKHRMVPVEEMVDEVMKKGKPANLIHAHIERTSEKPGKLSITDSYNFPPGYFGNSPQFIPRPGTDDPTDGYITCVVIFSDNMLSNKSEIWIFDAKNLNRGPCYRLSHPKLNMGLTIHSTWLNKLTAPPTSDYNVREDYQDLVDKTNSEAVKTLFERDIYPHYE